MSGDPRFTAELDLARRKVADLILDAEGDKKNKAVVKDLSRCWNYWVRETDEITTEDLKEYTLATAAGKSFDPADNNPQGGNSYIGAPIQYVSVPQPRPQAYDAPPSQPQAYYVQPPPPVYPVGRCLNSDGSFQPGCIPPQGANGTIYPSYAVPQTVPQAYAVPRAPSAGFFAQVGLLFKAPEERSGSTYRGTGQHPSPATHAAVVARATGNT
jgi:hypothetical protein